MELVQGQSLEVLSFEAEILLLFPFKALLSSYGVVHQERKIFGWNSSVSPLRECAGLGEWPHYPHCVFGACVKILLLGSPTLTFPGLFTFNSQRCIH